MDSYIEISIKPDPEMPLNRLLNAIYTKFHKALCDLNSTNIGISFPKYEVTLGNVLRIYGEEPVLNNLQGLDWIGGMKGYCKVNDITPVPAGSKFRIVSRKQTTMSLSKLNRLLKRGTITEEEVKNYKTKMFTKGLDNPYLELQSGSNGHKHRRYIEFGPLLDNPIAGEFDQFGLSKTATVPWF
ncbi:type I-F CRISPR-associated endoribonuclease Cas6/Csy4 [Zhongshania sp. BJYM1]|uniref:type I-F CRISPR-associated endoribonuclease Cas6/Csy4 n=1 Tax=Zhongshania aquatica TaxID=2965069 RepID=UPI0022B41C1E|nr:type I-F CRISPR-associated endoribonuclease Cas6/Csy4 [Marortus sp. BJYM1]